LDVSFPRRVSDIDATYFLELIGITDAFTVTCALFAVNLSCTLIAFPLIEVHLITHV
jgi:hypothetical protein